MTLRKESEYSCAGAPIQKGLPSRCRNEQATTFYENCPPSNHTTVLWNRRSYASLGRGARHRAEQIERDVRAAAKQLYANNPEARALANQAEAVLIFPKIVKAGFVFGGSFGEGALLENGHISGFYTTAAASYGFQAGVEQYGYALFFMSDSLVCLNSHILKSKTNIDSPFLFVLAFALSVVSPPVRMAGNWFDPGRFDT